eukprot:jgi/Botrbrau1/17185/Bobra.0157s0076.1
MNQVFELGGEVVPAPMAHNLMRLIAEGGGEDDEAADMQLRRQAVASYLTLLQNPKLPDILLQVIFWVLGEYGTLSPVPPADLIEQLRAAADTHTFGDTARGFLLPAIGKIAAHAGLSVLPPGAEELLHASQSSHNLDLQQRSLEVQALLSAPASVRAAVLPMDASCEELDLDPNLGFLDAYVARALAAGAAPYISEEERFRMGVVRPSHADEAADSTHSLRFAAYGEDGSPAAPTAPLVPAVQQASPARGIGATSRSCGCGTTGRGLPGNRNCRSAPRERASGAPRSTPLLQRQWPLRRPHQARGQQPRRSRSWSRRWPPWRSRSRSFRAGRLSWQHPCLPQMKRLLAARLPCIGLQMTHPEHIQQSLHSLPQLPTSLWSWTPPLPPHLLLLLLRLLIPSPCWRV